MRLTAAAGLIAAFVASALPQFGQPERCYSWPPRQTGRHATAQPAYLLATVLTKASMGLWITERGGPIPFQSAYERSKILAAGTSLNLQADINIDFALARYDSNGGLDTGR